MVEDAGRARLAVDLRLMTPNTLKELTDVIAGLSNQRTQRASGDEQTSSRFPGPIHRSVHWLSSVKGLNGRLKGVLESLFEDVATLGRYRGFPKPELTLSKALAE